MALTKINASVIANNTIAVGNIADNSVDATKIASNSILTRHIDDNQIGIDQLNVSDGSNGQALTTNGSGTLSFASAGESNRLPLAGGTLTGDLILGDGIKLELGAASGGDAQLFHSGSNAQFINATGDTYIQNDNIVYITNADTSKNSAAFDTDGAVTLYHNNSAAITTASDGVSLADDKKVKLGNTTGDLELYHIGGSVSVLRSTPALVIQSDDYISLGTYSGGELMLKATKNGAVDLYYDNVVKLATTTSGASISGVLGINVTANTGHSNSTGSIQIKGSNDNYQAANFNEAAMLSLDATNSEGRYASIRFTHNGGTEGFFGLVRRGGTSDITDFVWQMYNGTANAYQEHMRLSEAGLLGVKKSDPTEGIQLGGITYGYMALSGNLSGYNDNVYPTLKTDGNTLHFDANSTYTGYISNNSSWTDISDVREKENIVTISGATTLVKQLRGVYHTWKDTEHRGTGTHLGLIAQEVESIIPSVVTEGAKKEGETEATKGVAYHKLVPLLIESIKELEARIKTLEG